MNKKQAYNLAMYLLDEAYGLLNYADYTDIKAISNLLGTANYIAKSFNLREKEEIKAHIRKIREETEDYIREVLQDLAHVFY